MGVEHALECTSKTIAHRGGLPQRQSPTAVGFQKRKKHPPHAEKEVLYFSILDVVAILTSSPNPRKYWSVLKTRLKKEGGELTTNCSQLKMIRELRISVKESRSAPN